MLPEEEDARLKRVEFELRATGVKPEQVSPLRSGIHTRGYLPHVKREGARYFVTFRLADSLPTELLMIIQAERAQRLQQLHARQEAAEKSGTPCSKSDGLAQIERDHFRKMESYL